MAPRQDVNRVPATTPDVPVAEQVGNRDRVQYDKRLSRCAQGINLIEGNNCKSRWILWHPAFQGMQNYDLLAMMQHMIEGGLAARGVATTDYEVTITSIQLDHPLAALNSRISSAGSDNGTSGGAA